MSTLSQRHEFLYAYDIRMGNPNGDPNENRPRKLPDGTVYVTDVRLKRYVRDFFKQQGQHILVDTIESKTTNLTGRVAHYLKEKELPKAEGEELVTILLDAFIDARLFGSSFAFKKEDKWEPKTVPKTLTGAVQIQHGEVLHHTEDVDIYGTSLFGSDDSKTQGTFTSFYGLRYGFIAFNGIANEHSAKISRLTDDDYQAFLNGMWKGVRSAGNTRSKAGQVPRLLIDIAYKPDVEFQFGNLLSYITLTGDKPQNEWTGPEDYTADISKLVQRLEERTDKVDIVTLCTSPDLTFTGDGVPASWNRIDLDA